MRITGLPERGETSAVPRLQDFKSLEYVKVSRSVTITYQDFEISRRAFETICAVCKETSLDAKYEMARAGQELVHSFLLRGG